MKYASGKVVQQMLHIYLHSIWDTFPDAKLQVLKSESTCGKPLNPLLRTKQSQDYKLIEFKHERPLLAARSLCQRIQLATQPSSQLKLRFTCLPTVLPSGGGDHGERQLSDSGPTHSNFRCFGRNTRRPCALETSNAPE